ncbi:mucin-binding protein [Lacticaseibacillus nasuensis]|uniref:mucin-binding protein n=1 Tax=Lacticaseibacillus nasuensis TaxID=944671 RepID=UPI0022482C57|nr:MucBP domain-containing protein [Lacticaseibacillus nasuensis]
MKLFKGKGRWLATLLVAVGGAMTIQAQVTHAATTDTTETKPVEETAGKPATAAVALQTAKTAATPATGEPAATNETYASQTPAQSVATDDNAQSTKPNTEPTTAPSTTAPAQPTAASTAQSDQQPADSVTSATTTGTAKPTEQPAAAPAAKSAATDVPAQFKTAVDPVSATTLDSITWTKVDTPTAQTDPNPTLTLAIPGNGKTYTFTAIGGQIPGTADTTDAPLIYNTVTDGDNLYGYALRGHDGENLVRTSAYYVRTAAGQYTQLHQMSTTPEAYYTGQGADGTKYIRKDISDGNAIPGTTLTVSEILSIDPSGSFEHTVFIKNGGSTPLTDVHFGTMLDTAFMTLNPDDGTVSATNDGVTITANGDNSAYLTNKTETNPNGLTLYLTPIDNDSLTAGHMSQGSGLDITDRNSAENVAEGTVLQSPAMNEARGQSKDSAVDYETPAQTIAPGATISYSYSEHLYIQPIANSTITVKYQDENGGALKADKVVGGAVGSPFSGITAEDKTITDYTFDRQEGNATSFTANPQTITLIFNKPAADDSLKITYVDDDNDEAQVGDPVPESGKIGQSDTYTAVVPANYKLADNQPSTITYTFTTGDDDQQIHLAHQKVPVTPTDPHDAKDLTATGTRTIKYVKTDGSQAFAPVPQTVSFTRTGTEDLVTQVLTYDPWTPATASVPAVDSPNLTGYTPSQATVPADSLTPGAAKTVTVIYTIGTQKATITYQDVTEDKTLGAVDTITGDSGATSNYSSTDRINTYLAEGYKLVSDDTANGIVFDTDAGKDQAFFVKLAHTVVPVTPDDPHDAKPTDLNTTATRTIKYIKASDGSQVFDPVPQTVNFTRAGTEDLVTQAITLDPWTPANASVPAVVSPELTGYTPSQASVPADSLAPGADKTVTVTYTIDAQKATITYQDVTAGTTLGAVDTITGDSGAAANYSSTDRINTYLGEGYKLVSDDTANGIVFDTDTKKDQAFFVKLAHTVVPVTPNDPHDAKPIDLNTTATRTIKYVKASDGAQVFDPVTQTVTFTRTGHEDLVTKAVTIDTPWTPATSSVPAVNSKPLTGYTPDQAIVPADSLNPGDNVPVMVTYTIDTQQATITYQDVTAGKTLGAVDTITGDSGATSNYSSTDRINTYLAEGYKLVSDDTVNGIVFDTDAGKDQAFFVKLAHTVVPVTPDDPHDAKPTDLNTTATRTIKYVKASDGSQVFDPVTQTVTFTRTGHEDLVTKAVTIDSPWTPATSPVPAVNSKPLAGYTPDQAVVPADSLNPDDNVPVTVTYTIDTQKATITYQDVTAGTTLGAVDTITGDSGATANYSSADRITTYLADGYKLVSDDTANGIVFDTDAGKDQAFFVKLAHIVVPVTPDSPHDAKPTALTTTATRTIKYVKASDGSQVFNPVAQTVTFTRTGHEDLVTKAVTIDSPWTPAASSVPAVNSKPLAGYTPDQAIVPADSLNPGDNVPVTVTYTIDTQQATITYQDVTAGTILGDVDTITGDSGATANYSSTDRIQNYEGQGYELVSDDTANGIVFDTDAGKDQAFFVKLAHIVVPVTPGDPHDAKPTALTTTATRTIKYVKASDGAQVAEPVSQTVTFTRTGHEDLVTKVVTIDSPWAPATGSVSAVTSPTVPGYTPSQAVVAAALLAPNDAQTVTVTYTPQPVETQRTHVDYPGPKQTPHDEVTTKTPVTAKSPATAKRATLPQTGNQSDSALALLGTALLMLIGIDVDRKRRANQ